MILFWSFLNDLKDLPLSQSMEVWVHQQEFDKLRWGASPSSFASPPMWTLHHISRRASHSPCCRKRWIEWWLVQNETWVARFSLSIKVPSRSKITWVISPSIGEFCFDICNFLNFSFFFFEAINSKIVLLVTLKRANHLERRNTFLRRSWERWSSFQHTHFGFALKGGVAFLFQCKFCLFLLCFWQIWRPCIESLRMHRCAHTERDERDAERWVKIWMGRTSDERCHIKIWNERDGKRENTCYRMKRGQYSALKWKQPQREWEEGEYTSQFLVFLVFLVF